MIRELKFAPATLPGLLRCPCCSGELSWEEGSALCGKCRSHFPVVGNVPILINEQNSAFALTDFTNGAATTFHAPTRAERWFAGILPRLELNIKSARNYLKLAGMLRKRSAKCRVLIVGCGELREAMTPITSDTAIELVNTDVSFGPQTHVICDCHDLPFDDSTFDAVVVQAVLEHVSDPSRCVEEIWRVLQDDGLIYAETPFMQQVHGGAYDFTRFTHLGHRRLLRHFQILESGATCGSGAALAWAYQYFLLSFTDRRRMRLVIKAFARLTSFWLKYFDFLLIDTPGTLDAASGYYFLGQKCNSAVTDRELIGMYRGAGATLPKKRFA